MVISNTSHPRDTPIEPMDKNVIFLIVINM